MIMGSLQQLDALPPELLVEILSYLENSPCDVAAWALTCSTFYALCDEERRCRCSCLATWPVLFRLGLSPAFGGGAPWHPEGEEKASSSHQQLSWRLRRELLRHIPSRLQEGSTPGEPPLVHKLPSSRSRCTMTNLPFITTNSEALEKALEAVCRQQRSASQKQQQQQHDDDEEEEEEEEYQRREAIGSAILFRGVEYFEMTVVHNTISWNRAAAIAITQFYTDISFLGWNRESIAYHSDDGTIRGGLEVLPSSHL